MKGDISPDLKDFRFPSPDHQTWTDFTRFGEKSPGVATLLLPSSGTPQALQKMPELCSWGLGGAMFKFRVDRHITSPKVRIT